MLNQIVSFVKKNDVMECLFEIMRVKFKKKNKRMERKENIN